MESPKIFNPLVVIGDNKSHQRPEAAKPLKITCIEGCNSRLFVGTFDGELREYFITEEENLYSPVRSLSVGKNQPIVYLRSASALDSLLLLTGGILALYDLETLEVKGNNNVGNVTAVAIDENPTGGDPFVVELCFSRKSSIFICHVTTSGFQILYDINVDSLALAISVDSGLICAAMAVGHYVMVNTKAPRRQVQRLCDFDAREVRPKVVHAQKEEFLLLGPGSLGVFVSSSGVSERPPIIWNTKVNQIVVHNNYVVAAGEDCLHVDSLLDSNFTASVAMPDVKSVHVVEGNLYAWTALALFRLQTITIDEQVETLVKSNKVDSALNLLKNVGEHKHPVLARKLHQKSVFLCLSEGDLDGAASHFEAGQLDIREILALYKQILPASSTFVPMTELHSFTSIEDLCDNVEARIQNVASFVLDALSSSVKLYQEKDMCTSAIKLAGTYDLERFYLLAAQASDMNMDVDDVMGYFEVRKQRVLIATLMKELGWSEKCLDVLLSISAEDSEETEADRLTAAKEIVLLLSKCNDEDLLWKTFFKFLKIHPTLATEIFKLRAGKRGPASSVVVEKLYAFPEICRDYLEFLVFEHGNEESDIHTYLATMYIDKILASKSSSLSPVGNQSTRSKLLKLIIESSCIKHGFLVSKLQNTGLRQELAVVHGKAGDHAQALLVMTRELKNHGLARTYCQKLQNRNDKKRAYLELLRIYIDVYGEEEQENLVLVLSDFVQEFDLTSVLSLLPDGLPLSQLSSVLKHATRAATHKRFTAKAQSALAKRTYTDALLDESENNFGISIEETSICDDCNQPIEDINTIGFCDGLIGHETCMR